VARSGKCGIILLVGLALLAFTIVAAVRQQNIEAENRRIIREEVKAYLDEILLKIQKKKH
jgi:hypothetical protein